MSARYVVQCKNLRGSNVWTDSDMGNPTDSTSDAINLAMRAVRRLPNLTYRVYDRVQVEQMAMFEMTESGIIETNWNGEEVTHAT